METVTMDNETQKHYWGILTADIHHKYMKNLSDDEFNQYISSELTSYIQYVDKVGYDYIKSNIDGIGENDDIIMKEYVRHFMTPNIALGQKVNINQWVEIKKSM